MAHTDFKKLAPAVPFLIKVRYEEAKASLERCFDAWKNLADAVHYANFKADKTMLKTRIAECETIDLTKSEEGVTEFEAA